jgi:uncharacterized tellurite resistance protein B-like protein
MLNSLKKLLFENAEQRDYPANNNKSHRLEVATCAVFIELAKADGEFSEEEREFIISKMKKCFELDDAEVNTILQLAEQKVDKSVSIYEFTSELNNYLSQEEKESLIKNLWRLIYTDKKLNTYEDNLIKKIGLTMSLEHKTIIDLKLSVKKELNID